MKNYKITDKATKSIIGVVAMTPAQARRVESDSQSVSVFSVILLFLFPFENLSLTFWLRDL